MHGETYDTAESVTQLDLHCENDTECEGQFAQSKPLQRNVAAKWSC